MVLHQLKSKQGLAILAALSFLGLAGCGSEAGPSTPVNQPNASAPDPVVEVQAVGKVTATYRNGHLSFGAVTSPAMTASVTPQGFGPFTESLLTFDTNAGDGVGMGSCTSTQYCATVGLTNNTARIMQNTFVEITDYSDIGPPGATISWAGTPFTLSSAYASVFKNPGHIEAAAYGSFASAQRKEVEFKFDVGTATTFSFDVTTYATFTRTSDYAAYYYNVPAFDACTIAGHVLQTSADDVEVSFQLPFATTQADLTYDQAVIGSNGYVLLYSTGDAVPTANPTGPNQNILSTGLPYGLFPFWDDLAFDAGDGVCTAVVGAAPNRQLVVTWSHAKISTNQPGKTFSTEKVTYSLLLTELNDDIEFLYNLPTTITNLTRGSSATIGLRQFYRGSDQAYMFGYNGVSVPTADPSNYPLGAYTRQYNLNP